MYENGGKKGDGTPRRYHMEISLLTGIHLLLGDVLPTNDTRTRVKRPLLLHFESRPAIVKFISGELRATPPCLPNN